MSYTPGPWVVGRRLHEEMFASIMGADGHLIVNLGDGGNGIERQTANGYLIAAAPDLLEALKAALEAGTLLRSQCTTGTDVADVLDSFIPAARAATAKAEGKAVHQS